MLQLIPSQHSTRTVVWRVKKQSQDSAALYLPVRATQQTMHGMQSYSTQCSWHETPSGHIRACRQVLLADSNTNSDKPVHGCTLVHLLFNLDSWLQCTSYCGQSTCDALTSLYSTVLSFSKDPCQSSQHVIWPCALAGDMLLWTLSCCWLLSAKLIMLGNSANWISMPRQRTSSARAYICHAMQCHAALPCTPDTIAQQLHAQALAACLETVAYCWVPAC